MFTLHIFNCRKSFRLVRIISIVPLVAVNTGKQFSIPRFIASGNEEIAFSSLNGLDKNLISIHYSFVFGLVEPRRIELIIFVVHDFHLILFYISFLQNLFQVFRILIRLPH